MTVLIASFILSCLPVGYALTKIPPSQSCSPFRLYSASDDYFMFTTIDNVITTFPDFLAVFSRFVQSAAFVVPLAVVILLVIYYYYR